jgi:hypothetical protein
MDSVTVDEAVKGLEEVIDDFVTALDSRGIAPSRLEEIIEGDAELTGDDLDQQPERFVEDHLIWPILDVLGYEITPRPTSPVGNVEEFPDFRIDNLSASVVGENKSLNDAATARAELLVYLDSATHEYGLATDGYEWGVYQFPDEAGTTATAEPVIGPTSLKEVVRYVARDRGIVPYADLTEFTELSGELAAFFQELGHHNVRRVLDGLSRFHDRYVEALVGEGNYDHEWLNTPLVEALDAPDGASDSERVAFAALLIDRLAFLRLMRDRGVLDLELHDEWSEHNRGLNRFQGSFYEARLQPLFYEVLPTHPSQRTDTDAYGRPPMFAGGLFEPVLNDEDAYDVPDPAMQAVLTAFVEGEARTVINEAPRGSLLESYRQADAVDLAGRIAEWYGDVTRAYEAEIEYVEENIEPTLRRFSD